jgi:hypothetical protein
MMLPHPQSRELRNVRILVKVIASSGWPKPSPLRHFTSQKKCEPSVSDFRGDNVDLSEPTAPIALQHLHALPLQLSTGQILPAYAELLLGLRLRHRPPPYGSMPTRTRNRAGSPNLWKPSGATCGEP